MKNIKKWIIDNNIVWYIIIVIFISGYIYDIYNPQTPEEAYENCISYSVEQQVVKDRDIKLNTVRNWEN